MYYHHVCNFFFFQAEDGIRDHCVTGVQTCALPISITLREHLRWHAAHVAAIRGWKHVGIGSDLDGGFGLEESPLEIDSVADLHKAGAAVPAEHREAVLSTNWLRFLRSSLPRTS